MNKVQDRLEERLQSEILTEDMAAYTLEFFENEFQHRLSQLAHQYESREATLQTPQMG